MLEEANNLVQDALDVMANLYSSQLHFCSVFTLIISFSLDPGFSHCQLNTYLLCFYIDQMQYLWS